jgi:hypothetical protein
MELSGRREVGKNFDRSDWEKSYFSHFMGALANKLNNLKSATQALVIGVKVLIAYGL